MKASCIIIGLYEVTNFSDNPEPSNFAKSSVFFFSKAALKIASSFSNKLSRPNSKVSSVNAF